MNLKTVILFFIPIIVCVTSISAVDKQETEESTPEKSKKEWQALKDTLVQKGRECQLAKEKRDLAKKLQSLFPVLVLENKEDLKESIQMELRRLDWEIWDLAWAKETEKLNETMSLKKTKIEELSERKKDLRNFKDSLNSNINTDDSILLRELEKMENPKAEELIKLIQEKKDSKEIIEKLNILIPDSIEPTIHEIEGKSDLLKLKKLEEKRFTQKTNLSSQLTDELQEILKNQVLEFSNKVTVLQKEIQEIVQSMNNIPIL